MALVGIVGSVRRSGSSGKTSAPAFALGDSVLVGAGYQLFPTIDAYRSFASCEASRDYDNGSLARGYSRDAEPFGEVTRAAQARAYAAKQAALVCEAKGRLTTEATLATVARVERVNIRYEGLVPLSSKPEVVAITRDDTVYVVDVNGNEAVVSEHGLTRPKKSQ